ncbi:hypothetical protein F4604DRAFT_1682698 [Suillus subluteus]|nr:hypothetical protein F4604DRAFT_1682698 [Suillus subluteus]
MSLPSCSSLQTLDSGSIPTSNNSKDLLEMSDLDASPDLSEADQFLLYDSLHTLLHMISAKLASLLKLSFVVPVVSPAQAQTPGGRGNRKGEVWSVHASGCQSIAMAMLIHDPKLVDISGRRTHDAYDVLRTRRFGVMEIDDSYLDTSVQMTKDLSVGLTCVRSCDWTNHPCELFEEMSRATTFCIGMMSRLKNRLLANLSIARK